MQTASQQKSLTISKDYRGFITAQSRADLSEGERATFTFAINSFGFMIGRNMTIKGVEWMEKIRSFHDEDHPVTAEVLRVIGVAMRVADGDCK